MKKTIEIKPNIYKQHEEVLKLADEIIRLARDTITVRFRFFDVALAKVKLVPDKEHNENCFCIKDGNILYNPNLLLKTYTKEPQIAVRGILHILFHLVFLHQFKIEVLDSNYWNLATDIAVEKVILELDFKGAELKRDSEEKHELEALKRKINTFTADKIYREFMANPLDEATKEIYEKLFCIDSHESWHETESDEIIISEDEWKKISRRVKSEIENFSNGKHESDTLTKNLIKANKDRYSYRQLLEKFTISEEEITISDDEFDYVYYTYGLANYGNIPLVEPLEYREVKKVREFVIAIDTSASCRGELIKKFIQKTYDILKDSETFFSKINIHIIQCDASIQVDTKIQSEAEFHDFTKNTEIKGFGATDFRPVFSYVEELKAKGEFENLKGLIYFTDGYGVYPEKIPDYDVIFAFVDEDEAAHNVPGWAIKIIMEDELNEY